MRGTARNVYTRLVTANDPDLGVGVGENDSDDGGDDDGDDGPYRTSKLRQARQRYAKLRDADAYFKIDMTGVTTVMISLRQSPVDPETGRVVTPYQQGEDLFQNMTAVMDSIRYALSQKRGFDVEWARIISATRQWATPHCHLYLWVDDPHDVVDSEWFRPAVAKFVERTPRASWESHDVERGTVTVEHDPPRATDTYGEVGVVNSLRDIPPTAGCVYLGSQLPHFALAGDTEPWHIDRAVGAWVSSRNWFATSRGFPSDDEVLKLKQSEDDNN
ncbi:hypothetical protein [Salinirarus marinus]|uniref:hypothetical protein n=1 Tax=Salinirarus marinus TaxID=3068310 RepID=UPI003C6C0A1C